MGLKGKSESEHMYRMNGNKLPGTMESLSL
jgi:hypothetical protein